MNTKYDYEYIRENDVSGWEDQWRQLLDGRFIVEAYQLKEDQNSKLIRLGFTVKEVEDAIGHTGYTAREIDWYQSQPDRYTIVDGKFVETSGWLDAKLAADVALAEAEAAFEQRVLEIIAAQDSAGLKQYTLTQAKTYITNKMATGTTVATLNAAVKEILLKMVPYVL